MSVVGDLRGTTQAGASRLVVGPRRVDIAVYDAITRTPTPSLDRGMSKLTQAADYSRLWLGCAAILAATRGPRGRRAAVTGLASIGVASAVANLVLKPLGRRGRPDATEVPDARRCPDARQQVVSLGPLGVGIRLRHRGRIGPPSRRSPDPGARDRRRLLACPYGVHYPGDVLAGAFLGTTLAQITAGVVGRGS